MKKIIFILSLVSAFIVGYSQDSIQLSTLTDITSPPSTARFYTWYISGSDTFDRNIQRSYLMPFETSATAIWPYSLTKTLGLGTSTPSTTYKLDILGHQRITGRLEMSMAINWGAGASIFESGNNLYFYDLQTNEEISLSQLRTASQTHSAISGLTSYVSGGVKYFRLGGTASQAIGINLDEHDFMVYDDATNKISLSNGITSVGGDRLLLYSPTNAKLYSDDASITVDTSLNASSNGHTFNMGTEEFNITGNTDKDINITAVGSGRVNITGLTLPSTEFDTLKFDHGYIYEFNPSGLKISPNGTDVVGKQFTIVYSAEPLGVTINNFDAMQLNKGVAMKAFRNDTTATAYDDSTSWSASSIKDYVAANAGGGDVSIDGTLSAGQIPIATDASTIRGTDSLKWDNGRLEIGAGSYLKFVDEGAIYGWNEGLLFDMVGSSNDIYFRGTYINTANNNGIYIQTASTSTTVPMYSNNNYKTTGITPGLNGVSIIAGGSEGVRVEVNKTTVYDSLYTQNIVYKSQTANGGDTVWFVGKPKTGGGWTMDTATLNNPGYVIANKHLIPSFKEFYNDVQIHEGQPERRWISGFDGINFTYRRDLSPIPTKAIEMLQAAIEQRDEYIKELYDKNERMEAKLNEILLRLNELGK